jgi:hypothetical protein
VLGDVLEHLVATLLHSIGFGRRSGESLDELDLVVER